MRNRIEDYAMIGDCRSAALVGRDGSIDWLCLPRFDSPACFAALLGTPDNGRWLIAPSEKSNMKRAYRGDTMILETTYECEGGRARVIDFMPIGGKNPTVIRLVEGLAGKVPMRTELTIRFDYGHTIPWVNRTAKDRIQAIAGENCLLLHTPVAIHGEDLHSVADFTVRKGQTIPFVLTYNSSYLPRARKLPPRRALAATEKYWKHWSGNNKIKGKWRGIMQRSLLTLKALTYEPSGGIVAAPTTSLPEHIGGPRNWDYRYCWLRDASFTLLAFLHAGYTQEARRWQNWLIRAVAGDPAQIQTMYGVTGERLMQEWPVGWLSGFVGSRPVRIGNAAAAQLQLDIYGEMANVLAIGRAAGLPNPPRRNELKRVFLAHLEDIWRKPDEGIWEIRGKAQHFTHSKIMCWVAFDRSARVGSESDCLHWRQIADEIHADVLENGIDHDRGCFVQAYGSKHLDASLLMVPIFGFLPHTDPRVRRTVEEIEKDLLHEGLVRRYDTDSGVDGLDSDEGAFLACSFWLADNYILLGRLKEARQLFKRLSGLANDVGLLAEEYDPVAKTMLGNFPQAFSHVALVNTAINLMIAHEKK